MVMIVEYSDPHMRGFKEIHENTLAHFQTHPCIILLAIHLQLYTDISQPNGPKKLGGKIPTSCVFTSSVSHV